MKTIILLLVTLLSFSNVYAQEERIITITSIGQGKTKEEAKEEAIKKVIDLTHQTFISSKKEILRNKEVNEEIISNTNGQIQKTEVISEFQLPNNEYVISINVKISVTKLISFFESKGDVVEFKGGAFSQNIKLQKFNEDAETSVIRNFCLTSFEILKKSVDYQLKYSNPIVVGDIKDAYDEEPIADYKFSPKYGYYLKEYKPEDFIVKFTIDTKHNDSYFVFLNYFKKTIESLTMNAQEIEEYKNINKEIFVLKIDDVFYYLRNKDNLESLYNFIIKSNILPLSFKVSSNAGEIIPLLKNRFPSTYGLPLKLYQDHDGYDYKYEFHSLINATTINYDSYYFRTNINDWFKKQSINIFKSSNMYSFYKNFLKTVYLEDNRTKNDSRINAENKNKEPNNYLFINTKEVNENCYTFCELFTLDEIGKIDNFQVTTFDLEDVLKNEEERLRNIKLVKLDGGGYEPYEDFYGRKHNDYQQLVGNGTIANFIEILNDRVLVKIYRTKCSNNTYCDQGNPGKLFYIPINKVLKYLKGSDDKNEKGEISYKFN